MPKKKKERKRKCLLCLHSSKTISVVQNSDYYFINTLKVLSHYDLKKEPKRDVIEVEVGVTWGYKSRNSDSV